MRLVTLGGLSLEGTDVSRTKPLLLLAYLALEGEKERQHLAELFWMGASDPLNSLSKAINQLRHEAPGIITAGMLSVQANVDTDAAQLLTALDQGRQQESGDLYRGPFLKGVYLKDWSSELEEWIYGTRETLATRVREAQLLLAEHEARNGRFEGAAKRAESAYFLPGAAEPDPDDLTRIHALLVAGSSIRAEEVRSEAESFGITLDPSTEGARARFTQEHNERPSLRTNLPAQATPFVGRQQEKTRLAEQLLDPGCRLVSIIGPGGIGKTRLAIKVAQTQHEAFADGVALVPFAPVADADGMTLAIGDALGITFSGQTNPKNQLLDHLRSKRVLLVLDNLEHLLAGVRLIPEILEGAPGVKVLATSRERLNLHAERVFDLAGMTTPADDPGRVDESDALRLFHLRASSSRADFTLGQDRAAVSRICRLVGGMPLAIELAREVGTSTDIGMFLWYRIMRERNLGSFAQMESHLRGIVEELRELGNLANLSQGLLYFGSYLVYNDHLSEGEALLREALELGREVGFKIPLAAILNELALAAFKRGITIERKRSTVIVRTLQRTWAWCSCIRKLWWAWAWWRWDEATMELRSGSWYTPCGSLGAAGCRRSFFIA